MRRGSSALHREAVPTFAARSLPEPRHAQTHVSRLGGGGLPFETSVTGAALSTASKTVGTKQPESTAPAPAWISMLESAPVHRMAIRYPNNDAPRMDDPLLAQLVGRLVGGFAGNNHLKANAVQIFTSKGVTSFKTV